MERHKGFILILLLLLLLLNVGSLRGESAPGRIEARRQVQADDGESRTAKKRAPKWQNDKPTSYQVLEWIIMQNLIKQYQKLEESDPEDSLD